MRAKWRAVDGRSAGRPARSGVGCPRRQERKPAYRAKWRAFAGEVCDAAPFRGCGLRHEVADPRLRELARATGSCPFPEPGRARRLAQGQCGCAKWRAPTVPKGKGSAKEVRQEKDYAWNVVGRRACSARSVAGLASPWLERAGSSCAASNQQFPATQLRRHGVRQRGRL